MITGQDRDAASHLGKGCFGVRSRHHDLLLDTRDLQGEPEWRRGLCDFQSLVLERRKPRELHVHSVGPFREIQNKFSAAVSARFRKDLSLGIVYLHQGARQSGAAFIFYAACDPLCRFRISDFRLRIADCGLRIGKRGIRNL